MKNANLEDVFRRLPIKGDTVFTNIRGKFQQNQETADPILNRSRDLF